MTKQEYLSFVATSKYDEKKANGTLNPPFFQIPIKEFFAEQQRKFGKDSNGDEREGCCLNFSAYLTQALNGIFFTSPDRNNATHCAVCHLNQDGKVVITDPSVGVIRAEGLDENGLAQAKDSILQTFEIPLLDYNFVDGPNIRYKDWRFFTGDESSGDLTQSNLTLCDALIGVDWRPPPAFPHIELLKNQRTQQYDLLRKVLLQKQQEQIKRTTPTITNKSIRDKERNP